jgi:hypothetical protein
MAAITFNPKGGAVVNTPKDETPAQVTLEVATAQNQSLAVTPSPLPDTGNITRDDILLPRVNLVQKSGKLCDDFPPGSFLFEKQVVIAKPSEGFFAVVLGHTKYYQEKVEYGSDDFGRRANTEDEVRNMGGTTTWGVADKPYFQPVADLLMAVKAPEGADEETLSLFPFEHKGEHYAIAVYTVASSAYTSLAKRIFTDSLYTLKAGLHLGEYHIKSELKRNAANSWYVPVTGMPKKYNDPEKAEFFASLRN